MASSQVDFAQQDFSSGMVRDVAPHLIPQDGAFDIQNGLLNEDGSIYRRGGTVNKSNAAFGAGQRFIWDGIMHPGPRTLVANGSDFGALDADDQTVMNIGGPGLAYPKSAAYIQGLLFIGGGSIYGGSRKTANYTTGTVSVTNGSKTVTGSGTTWNTLVDAGMLFQRGNERVYVIESVDSTTQVTLRDAYQGVTGAGISYTFSPLYSITAADPYEVAEVYAVSQNRLVYAIGNRIRFTEINNPHSITNSLGTTNEHTLAEGIEVTGIGVVGPNTIIFTTAGIWTLAGLALDIVDVDGTPLHRLQVLTRDLILFGQAGIATWEQLLVAPCTNGVYLIDGISRPILLSQNVMPLYTHYTGGPYRPGGAVVHRDHYLLPILGTSGEARELLVCRLSRLALDRRRRTTFAWTRFNGQGGALAAFCLRVGTVGSTSNPILLGAEANSHARVVDCTGYFLPSALNKNDSDGSTHVREVITRDIETGNLTLNVVRRVRWRRELTDAGSDNPTEKFAWSDGAEVKGLINFGDADFNTFDFNAGPGTAFYNLGPDGGTSDGATPHSCRRFSDASGQVKGGKRVRFIRLRSQTYGPCASSVLRSVEVLVRPAPSVRR